MPKNEYGLAILAADVLLAQMKYCLIDVASQICSDLRKLTK